MNQAQNGFLTFIRKGKDSHIRGPEVVAGMEVCRGGVLRLDRKAWEGALGIRAGLPGGESGGWRPSIAVLAPIVQPPFILPRPP